MRQRQREDARGFRGLTLVASVSLSVYTRHPGALALITRRERKEREREGDINRKEKEKRHTPSLGLTLVASVFLDVYTRHPGALPLGIF